MAVDDQQPKKRTGCLSALVITVVVLPILYIFSYGPVMWLVYHKWLPFTAWIRIVYYPLHWMVGKSDAFRALFVWYVQWWGG